MEIKKKNSIVNLSSPNKRWLN